MKRKKKNAARISPESSQDPRNPRKAPKGKGKAAKTARARQVREAAQTEVNGLKAWTDRVVDTVELLFRRRQIDRDQRTAAGIYRDAWEACEGGIGCPLNVERVRGGGIPTPTEAKLLAARRLAEAHRCVGQLDATILDQVVGKGCTIEETAGFLFGTPRRCDSEHVGRRLRLALTMLADAWGVGGRGHDQGRPRLRAVTAEPVASPVTGRRQVERARVAHATGRKVYDI